MLAISLVALATLIPVGDIRDPAPVPDTSCATPEARQLDFWIGDWELTGRRRTPGGWVDTPGTNRVRAALGSCVIEEQFRSAEADGLEGRSVSVYDTRAGAWRQTWVDNQGGYLVFRGGMDGDRMILATAPTVLASGDTMVSRMVFHDITTDRLVWDWERTTDAGRSWTVLWTLEYRRRPSTNALLEADRAFARAVAENRLDAWVSFFADSGTQFRSGGTVVGPAAVREFMAPAFADTTWRLTWEPQRAEIATSGDLGYTIGRYESRKRTSSGEAVVRTGSYVTIWRWQADGQWKVAVDIGNPDN